MKHYTGSAVAQVTKDRAARPHLPSTVYKLGRRRRKQLLTIAQWNVRTLLDREAADRPERPTAFYNQLASVLSGIPRVSFGRLRQRHWNNHHVSTRIKVKKVSCYIAQYPVLRTVQSALHFTSLTDLFTQKPSQLLWKASSHMLQLMREGCSYTYPPLSIARYSFTHLSELEQCRVKKLAQGFNTAARIRTRVLVVEGPNLYP